MKKYFAYLTECVHSNAEKILQELDNGDSQIELYKLDEKTPLKLDDILYIIDSSMTSTQEKLEYVFFSNVHNLFFTVYRIYHQIFDAFLWIQEATNVSIPLVGIYQTFSNFTIHENEALYKPIYTNHVHNVHTENHPMLSYYNYLENDEGLPASKPENLNKYYYLNDRYYLFEPVCAKNRILIPLDHEETVPQSYENTEYLYDHSQQLNDLYHTLKNGKDYQDYEVCCNIFDSLKKESEKYTTIQYQLLTTILHDITYSFESNTEAFIFFLSFLIKFTKDSFYCLPMYQVLVNGNNLTLENKHFLWNQLNRISFTNMGIANNARDLRTKAYRQLVDGYSHILHKHIQRIPKEDRNTKTILIFVRQFLGGTSHAPTKSTLERCYTLGYVLKYKVILINTRELYPHKGYTPFYQPAYANEQKDYSGTHKMEYKNFLFSFYQTKKDMPDIDEMLQIIHIINAFKPYFILNIGGSSIIADICGKIVPEATLNVVFSALPMTTGTFSIIGKRFTDEERKLYREKGYADGSIIESTFTFELAPQTKTVARKDLDLPEDKFLLVVVGTRLDYDIHDAFIHMLEHTYSWNCHIVFAGFFYKYEEWCKKHPQLLNHSTYLGYFNDMLALMEICDLYVNPLRTGGGFSIIEAFHKGKPGVTIGTGDVSVAAGKDFWVKDYEEMLETIRRYVYDGEFYKAMSDKALARERVMTDSVAALKRIVDQIENSPLFF